MVDNHSRPAIGWPTGFRAYTGSGGIRESGDDISFVVSDRSSVAAAMFTKSLFAGPAVVLSRENAADADLRAVITLAQNANVATGPDGHANAAEVVDRVAARLGIRPQQVLIGSTGVIGRPLPMPSIRAFFDAFLDQNAHDDQTGQHADPVDGVAVVTAQKTTKFV